MLSRQFAKLVDVHDTVRTKALFDDARTRPQTREMDDRTLWEVLWRRVKNVNIENELEAGKAHFPIVKRFPDYLLTEAEREADHVPAT